MERCKDKVSQIKETTMMEATSHPKTHHRNDTTCTEVAQRGKKHLSKSQFSNNIASSDYKIFDWSEQPIEFNREDHPIIVSRPRNAPLVLKAQIGGYDAE
jgi:DNA-binding transcriptional regulator YiaG